MDGPTAQSLQHGHAGVLEGQTSQHLLAVVAGHRQRIRVAQEVRCVKEVDVQGVALQPLAPVQQSAQAADLGVDIDLEEALEGLDCG